MAPTLLWLFGVVSAIRSIPTHTKLSSRVCVRTASPSSPDDLPANDPRGVTGRFSVFAPNATETVTVCEFRAGLKQNLEEFRTRGTVEERHERYQASSTYLDALAHTPPEDLEGED